MAQVHEYRSRLAWTGSTGAGCDASDRAHAVTCPPAGAVLALSSDPASRGDPERLSPEQLLLAAASSCQLLSFLATCARARIDIVAYADEAEALMSEDAEPMQPRIEIRP